MFWQSLSKEIAQYH